MVKDIDLFDLGYVASKKFVHGVAQYEIQNGVKAPGMVMTTISLW